jgi:hypothetical protein
MNRGIIAAAALGAALLVCAGSLGCGGSASAARPNTGSIVVGKVLIDGQPAVAVQLRFIPTDSTPGFGGTAVSNASGEFLVEPVDGAKTLPEGKYKVTVETFRLPEDPTLAEKYDVPAGQPSVVPHLYADEHKTPLSVVVLSESRPVEFTLRSR